MQLTQEMFAIKLYELEQQYGQLISRLRLWGQDNQETLRQKRKAIEDEYKECQLHLKTAAECSRSPAAAQLARLYLDFFQDTGEILSEKLPASLHSEANSCMEDNAEAAALYAEYAIDFAIQSMRYALITALTAMDLQMDAEKEKQEESNE